MHLRTWASEPLGPDHLQATHSLRLSSCLETDSTAGESLGAGEQEAGAASWGEPVNRACLAPVLRPPGGIHLMPSGIPFFPPLPQQLSACPPSGTSHTHPGAEPPPWDRGCLGSGFYPDQGGEGGQPHSPWIAWGTAPPPGQALKAGLQLLPFHSLWGPLGLACPSVPGAGRTHTLASSGSLPSMAASELSQ